MTGIKKTIVLLLCLCLCFTACTDRKSTGATPPDAGIDTAITPSDLKLSFTTEYDNSRDYTICLDRFEVSDDNHIKLKEALESWLDYGLNIDEDIEMLDEFLEYGTDPSSLQIDSNIEIARMDKTVLSLLEERYINGGGAHPNTIYSSVNFDVNTGEVLSIKDLVYDYDEFKEAASTYILDKIDNSDYAEGMFEDSRELIEEFSEDTFDWTISQYGLNIYYETYTLGSYAMGPVHISLPYNEFEDYMKPEYFEINDDCICSVFNGSALNQNTLLPTKNGVLELSINTYYTDYYDIVYDISCGLDSTTLQGASICSEKLMLIDDIWYLAVTMDMASGDYVTTLYRLEENQVTVSDTIDAYYTPGTVSANKATMASNIYLMGTYAMERDYYIEDGKFVPENDLYTLVSTDYVSELTTTRELPVSINGEDFLLPVGSKVRMDQTDAESIVYLYVIDTGEIAELQIEKKDTEYFYEILIDGISETEYFEMLPYAG